MRHPLKSFPIIATALILVIMGWLGTLPVESALEPQLVDAIPIGPYSDWNRTQPQVAYDSSNHRYLFVWRDKRHDEADNRWDQRCDYHNASPYCWPNADIYGHLVDGDGTVHPGVDIHIASDPVAGPRDQQWPHVSFDPVRAEYLVAWQEVSPLAVEEGSSTNWLTYCYDIKAQRVGADGSLLGGPITVSEAADCQWVPVMSYDLKLNKVLLAWHDNRYRGGMEPAREYESEKEIFAQWLSYSDDQLVPEIPGDLLITRDTDNPSLPAPQYQQYSTIAYDSVAGNHYVLWSDDRLPDEMTAEHHYDIYLQRVSGADAGPLVNRLLFQAPYVQEKPRASFNRLTDQIWAVWQTYEGFELDAHDFTVQLAHFVPDDAPLSEVRAVAAGLNAYPLPDVACSGLSGNCLVVWQEEGLAYQAFDRSGAPLGPPARLSGFASNGPLYARAIASDRGSAAQFLMTFSHEGRIYFVLLGDEIPTPTPTATLTPTFTPTSTPTGTPTVTATPAGQPDLTASSKTVFPETVDLYEPATFTITVRNDGELVANVTLSDRPPEELPYWAGSASGGILWDDLLGVLAWEGELAAGESRQFSYIVHGPAPTLEYDTVLENQVTIDDGVHLPFVRSASVLANPRPTATPSAVLTVSPSRTGTPSPTGTTTPTATPTTTPSPLPTDELVYYLPLMTRASEPRNLLR